LVEVQHLIDVRFEPKTRAKAVSASGERMDSGGLVAKGGGK
jgi:hypothetical protein